MIKIADKIYRMIDQVVEVVEENVVQIMTNTATNYKAAGAMLMLKRKRLYWTSFAIQCIDLMKNKGSLIRMFTSNEWTSSQFAKTSEGQYFEEVIIDKEFWKKIAICLKGAYPLIKVLRLVDSNEKLAMGFIYEAMDQAR